MRVLSRSSLLGRSSFGPRLPHLVLGPPLPFLTTSAACPAHRPAGLLHPATGHGVRHVSVVYLGLDSCSVLPRCAAGGSRVGPTWRRTLRSFSLDRSSCCVTAADTLLALAPVRALRPSVSPRWNGVPSHVAPTSGLCSAVESVSGTRRCRRVLARCSLGLLPLRCRSCCESALSPADAGSSFLSAPRLAPWRAGR
jgi:hypothetical protein